MHYFLVNDLLIGDDGTVIKVDADVLELLQ